MSENLPIRREHTGKPTKPEVLIRARIQSRKTHYHSSTQLCQTAKTAESASSLQKQIYDKRNSISSSPLQWPQCVR